MITFQLIRFNQIFVTDVKANFLWGKGDLEVVVYRVLVNCSRPEGPPQLFGTSKITCCNFCNVKFSQGELFFKNQSTGKGRALEKEEFAGWLMYEKDNRRKYEKCSAIPECFDICYTWRSKQSEFGIEWYFAWDYCFTTNNWYDFPYSYPDGCVANFSIKQVY